MNKFKDGDEVIYINDTKKYKAKIFGVAKKEDWTRGKYAITFIDDDGSRVNLIVGESQLHLAKIEVGDIVKYCYEDNCKVLEIKDEKDMADKNVLLQMFYDEGFRYRFANIDNLELVKKGDE